MDAAVFVCRLLVAAVLLTSGLAKAFDRRGTVEMMRSLGMGSKLSAPTAAVLPFLEIVIGSSLLIPRAAGTASDSAVVLFAVFSLVAGAAVLRGVDVACHCFGQITEKRLDGTALARNLALTAVAALAAVEASSAGTVARWQWLHDSYDVAIVSLTLAALLGAGLTAVTLILLQVMRQNGQIMLTLDGAASASNSGGSLTRTETSPRRTQAGLAVSVPAPGFSLRSLAGQVVSLADLLSAQLPAVLVFTDPACGPCTALLPEVATWQHALAGQARVAVIAREAELMRSLVNDHRLEHVLIQEDREVADLYRASATPSAVLVHSNRSVGSPLAQGADEIRALVTSISTVSPLAGGNVRAVPDITLPSYGPDGEGVRLMDLREPTVLVFWNGQCPFCLGMAGYLEVFASARRASPAAAPELVVISSTPEVGEVSALPSGLDVLFDPDFAVGSAVDANGTPAAVRLDGDGHAVMPSVSGATAVMNLLNEVRGSVLAGAGTGPTA